MGTQETLGFAEHADYKETLALQDLQGVVHEDYVETQETLGFVEVADYQETRAPQDRLGAADYEEIKEMTVPRA